eukprot:m51a1_g7447 hypothetical protein (136) ;mRNA; r:100199-100606
MSRAFHHHEAGPQSCHECSPAAAAAQGPSVAAGSPGVSRSGNCDLERPAQGCLCAALRPGPLDARGPRGLAVPDGPPRLARVAPLPDPVGAVSPLILDSYDVALSPGALADAAAALGHSGAPEAWSVGLLGSTCC